MIGDVIAPIIVPKYSFMCAEDSHGQERTTSWNDPVEWVGFVAAITAVKRNNGKTYEYWEGRVTIVSNYNGKQQKTLTAKTQAELIAKMKEAEQAVADEIVFAVQDIS